MDVRYMGRGRGWRQVMLVGMLLCGALAGGCGGCNDEDNPGTGTTAEPCPAGEIRHPITNLCTPNRVDPNPRDMDTSGDGADDLDMGPGRPDLPSPDMPVTMVDLGDSDRCATGIDSDGDGLNNNCECMLGTDPGSSDSDGDSLPDGFEDANKNCRIDSNETNPRSADTDGDGVDDGDELRANMNPKALDTDGDGIADGIEYNSCLDPTKTDTDGDGINDDEEDLNKDGKIGICSANPRQYEATCAQGELDPCAADSDGDGTPDGEEISALGCREEYVNALVPPKLINSSAGDYQLAINPATTDAQVTGVGAGVHAHVFNHKAESYAGFVATLPSPSSSTGAEAQRDALLARLTQSFNATLQSSGRATFTHDGYAGLVSVRVDLGAAGSPAIERDKVLRAILASGGASHSLSETFNSSINNLTLVMSVVHRGSAVLVSGAVVDQGLYADRALSAGLLVDDATSASNLATSGAMLEPTCVSYRVNDRPSVDFLWIIDGSGSMSDENSAVASYASTFTQILNASNIDWRLGVAGSGCLDMDQDTAIPGPVRALYGNKCTLPPLPFPIPISNSPYQNGKLCDKNGANFTDDPSKFTACVSDVANQGTKIMSEHTGSVAAAAVARALPRSDTDPTKFRPNAATVVISVTDEFDDMFESEMGWPDAGSGNNPPNDPSTSGVDYARLDSIIQPFVDYLLSPEAGVTMFGIMWVPGQTCSTASEAAVGIQRMVDRTGGGSGNICGSSAVQNVLQQIALASAGLASGLRVQGVPVTPSITVRVGDVQTQQVLTPPRNRQQGWDYDIVTNAVLFNGQNPPQTNDRVVITYMRWQGSTVQCMSDSDCPNSTQKQRCISGVCL